MTKFSDLKLDPKVLQAIAEAGYETPTPIQCGAIPPALEGRDVLGIAQTGTGKTAGFVLPMITLLGRGRARARMPRSLVLCPTRELAAQVAENFDTYAKHTRLTKALLIGGVSFGEQDKLIDRGVDVLIATPGRLLDHFERGKLLLTGVQIMVVDEADRMLDMGFIPDIERIFQMTPFTRQTLFFSATMAPEIERITNTFLHAPERIEVARQATASETITQRLIELRPTRKDQTAKQKRDLLRCLIEAEGEKLTNAIIFCNRKVDVDILSKSLAKHGYDAAPIHGDLDQSQRTRTLESFRDGKLRLLIASDVAARGLDIPAVSHVLNYDLPSHAEDYIHRIGRTGRAGRLGTAISIATPSDDKYLAAIEQLVKQTLPRVAPPEGFALSDDARPAPREAEREDRSGGSRTRRRRGPRREDEQTAEPAAAPTPVAPDTTVAPVAERPAERPAERAPERAPERAEEPRNPPERRAEPRRDDRRNDRNERNDNRNSGRGSRGGSDNRGPRIVGMGDHVPGFMLVELRSAILDISSDDVTESAPDAQPVAAQDQATQSAPEKTPAEAQTKRRRRSRGKSADSVAAQTDQSAPLADAEPQPAPQPVMQDAAPAEPTAEQPAAPKPARSRRKKVTPSEDAPAEAQAATGAEPAPKPRRSRKAAAEPEAAPENAPTEAEVAPKPTRSRRKKGEPAAETADEAEAKPAPKPRRSRKKVSPADGDDQPKDAAASEA